jgi:hypothetical protein
MGRKATKKALLHDIWYRPEYFDRHSVPDPDSDCVIWDGPRHRQGYGMVGLWLPDGTKKMTTTHRIAARRKYGRALASDQYIAHICGNPACVNPDHLELGDNAFVRQLQRERGSYANAGRPPRK